MPASKAELDGFKAEAQQGTTALEPSGSLKGQLQRAQSHAVAQLQVAGPVFGWTSAHCLDLQLGLQTLQQAGLGLLRPGLAIP
jgi:hypothetical protein